MEEESSHVSRVTFQSVFVGTSTLHFGASKRGAEQSELGLICLRVSQMPPWTVLSQ